MDHLRLAALTALMSGPRPLVVGRYIQTAAAATISPSVPKISGLLCVKIIFNWGGTAAPGTPTGFTNIANLAANASRPGVRIASRFLNGSEATAIASAATAATEMTAISYLIRGCSPLYPPQANTGTASSTTDFLIANHTGTLGGTGRLFIGAGMAVGANSLVLLAKRPPFTWDRLVQLQASNFTFGADANDNISNFTASGNPFVLGTSANGVTAIVNVRGG